MTTFESTRRAFERARERASVAAALEANTLHMAIWDARESGMSIRQTAAALHVPKSTVSRHWRPGHRCGPVVPVWGSREAWRQAHDAIWAHDETELSDTFVPCMGSERQPEDCPSAAPRCRCCQTLMTAPESMRGVSLIAYFN